jgi:hypothetical protein
MFFRLLVLQKSFWLSVLGHIYTVSFLSCCLAWQLSRDDLAEAGFLCGKVAVTGDRIKENYLVYS